MTSNGSSPNDSNITSTKMVYAPSRLITAEPTHHSRATGIKDKYINNEFYFYTAIAFRATPVLPRMRPVVNGDQR
jgi:hypothetical protein